MKERLLSVDVLRGMTIFFMILVNTPGSWSYVYAPLRHAEWHGCTPTDLVFPLFLFISGVSMALSFFNRKNQTTKQLLVKTWKRAGIIFMIGLLLNWFPFYHLNIADLRIMGVLQRIALAYGIGGTIVLIFNMRDIIVASAIILLGYQVLLLGYGQDPYSLEDNLARYIDLMVLGKNHLYGGFGIPFDPEGLLHSFPAAINVVLGYLLGNMIFSKDKKELVKTLSILGIAFIIIGIAWGFFFPINKPLWTSSYVLYTVGIGSVIWALLIYIIDIVKLESWTYLFRVFGRNPLASYVLSGLIVKMLFRIKIGESNLYSYFYQKIMVPIFGNLNGSLGTAILYVMFIWFFAWLLYKNNKIIKI
jgi:predicted acyltransferase